MQGNAPLVPLRCVIQPFCGAPEGSRRTPGHIHKESPAGPVYGRQFCGQHSVKGCRNRRIHIHKVFRGIAQRGKCSMGWFFGFKLHIICNEKGELLNFMFTPGDVDDRKPLEYKAFVEFLYGRLVADKGYISKRLFERLFVDGIQLVTKLKNNMRGHS